MASRYRWRQQLLGSLQGQLQLATYLVVFLGFTGASSVGLLIGQRNLLANDQQLARQSIALCDNTTTLPASSVLDLSSSSTPLQGLQVTRRIGTLIGNNNLIQVDYSTTSSSVLKTKVSTTLAIPAQGWCPT